jgi:hypothetical protein
MMTMTRQSADPNLGGGMGWVVEGEGEGDEARSRGRGAEVGEEAAPNGGQCGVAKSDGGRGRWFSCGGGRREGTGRP